MIYKYIFIVFSILTLFACKNKTDEISETRKTVNHYYFVRHAEKDTSNPNDGNPTLTKEGLLRAKNLSNILIAVNIDAVYSTNYKRTLLTAKPTADKNDLETTVYKPNELDVAEILKAQKNTLIVGHSNTIPKLVNSIINSEVYNKNDDNDFGNLYHVVITNGEVSDYELRRY
ncbi:histidine phosphatase family protein [Algibacter sp. AS12]|uniref:SixA phosphatase family protein n=1 Tax=Algibacter sp. AS12 TaxID=3135773 RepID=UPI00398B7C22